MGCAVKKIKRCLLYGEDYRDRIITVNTTATDIEYIIKNHLNATVQTLSLSQVGLYFLITKLWEL